MTESKVFNRVSTTILTVMVTLTLLPILLITILTTPLVFCVTGHAVQLTIRLLQKRGGDAQ